MSDFQKEISWKKAPHPQIGRGFRCPYPVSTPHNPTIKPLALPLVKHQSMSDSETDSG